MPNPSSFVHRIHFEDFDGFQFERLVFAYHTRSERWQSLEWYGQTGSDLGRDIWGVRENGETVCIQYVNRNRLSFAKARDDLAKMLSATKGSPECFRSHSPRQERHKGQAWQRVAHTTSTSKPPEPGQTVVQVAYSGTRFDGED